MSRVSANIETKHFRDRLRWDQHKIWEWNQADYDPEPRSPYTCITAAFMEWMPLYGPVAPPDNPFFAHARTIFR